MKKSYIKPELCVELFEVDTIMDDPAASPVPIMASNILNTPIQIESAGNITFSDGNTLQSINYKDFLK